MMAHISDRPTRPRCLYRTTLTLFLISWTTAFLQGCAVDDICVVSYTSSAEVKPAEAQPRSGGVVGSSPFPWHIVLSGVSDILTGARKKAIENKVGYRESRSFTLFRLKKADSQSERCSERSDAPAGDAVGEQEK